MILNIVLLFLGLLLLFYGSEWLVTGSASIALRYSIRPIIIGLTIVAFGTSSPEFLVSLFASQVGENGISIGNILGSNVINIALVLGAGILAKPITVKKENVFREAFFMVITSGIFWIFCYDGVLRFMEGLILVVILGLFLVFGVFTAKDSDFDSEIDQYHDGKMSKNYIMILISIIFLCAGAHLVVDNAVTIAEQLNVSKTFIGISIVALGTSLPELATTIIAARKDESDIALGNVVGSNMFNICMVMGVVGMMNPLIVEKDLNCFEFPFMIFVSLAVMFFVCKGHTMGKKHGIFFIACFAVYIVGSYMSVNG